MDDLLDLNFQPSSKDPQPPPSASPFDQLLARPATTPNYQITPKPPIQPSKNKNDNNDAFSSLFQSQNNSTPQNPSNLTIAQRLQAAQSTSTQSNGLRPDLFIPQKTTNRSSSESWDFDLLDKPKLSQPIPPSVHSTRPTQTQSSLISSDWDTDLLSDLPQSTTNSNVHLLELDQPPQSTSDSLLGNEFGPVHTVTQEVGSITFGDEPSSNDDDLDILGTLGGSVHQVRADRIDTSPSEIAGQSSRSSPNSTTPNQNNSRRSRNQSDSPPPHILGQVVEIGFAPSLSRQALTHTRDPKTGSWDVQSAIEILLSSSGTQLQPNFDDDDELPRNPTLTGKPVGREAGRPNRPCTDNRQISSTLPGVNAKEIQDQAAELLAQASAYGSTALGKAASFWKQSKSSLTKVIEDQTGSKSSSNDGDPPRPKWMREPSSSNIQIPTSRQSSSAPFSDNSHANQKTTGLPPSNPRQPYVSSSRRKVAERTVTTKDVAAENFLFSSSSNVPAVGSGSQTSTTRDPKSQQQDFSEKRSVTPSYQFPTWPTITLSQDLINQSESYRIQGNEFFKQGQYANAEGSYTRALDVALQHSNSNGLETATRVEKIYLGSLPIYNNRSMARLKNGDGKGALSDAERVIEIILCEDKQMTSSIEKLKNRIEWTQSTRIPNELRSHKNFNVEDQFGKALSKRARIFEDFEKWNEAKKDWEMCRSLGNRVFSGAGGLKMVTEGLRRCSQALNSGTNGVKKLTTSNNHFTSKPNNQNQNQQQKIKQDNPSREIGKKKAEEAIKKLREKEKIIEEENHIKFESQDLVDTKISQWKLGKENNLRGLLIGLDSILWQELGWNKVNLSQLLSNSQLKIHYLKAISKVHPDKVPKDATIFQQLIAESVFSTLNDAWISFQNSPS